MKFLGGIFFAIVVLCIIGAMASSSSSYSSNQAPATAPAPEQSVPDLQVTAEKLWADYQANEVAADNVYKGRRLRVTGMVDSINKDFLDDVYVVLSSPNMFMGVHAGLEKEYQSQAAQLQKGQVVTFDCIGGTMIIGSPMVEHCSFAVESKPEAYHYNPGPSDPTVYPSNPPDAEAAVSTSEVISQATQPVQGESESPTASAYPCGSDGVCRVGNGVTAPVPVISPEAEYSDEARQKKIQGVVLVSTTVDARGNPQNPTVIRPLGYGLDDRAIQAVQKYKFTPARNVETRQPVPVMVTIEVNFRL